MRRRHLMVPAFSQHADAMRDLFDAQQRDYTSERRFVWDYWHVPAQYTYVRTPALGYFPSGLIGAFVAELEHWGADTLGCPNIHTCWLSYYVDGCVQELHTDVRHGPWAFSFSLTRWAERRFTGGETRLMRPEVLDYWRAGADSFLKTTRMGSQHTELWEEIPPCFNQLLVFDGRIPHAVQRVEGTRDPVESRLVLHGWFADPKLYVSGSITREHASFVVDQSFEQLEAELDGFAQADGSLIVRLTLDAGGRVERVAVLTDTLETTSDDPSERDRLSDALVRHLAGLHFGALPSEAVVTVPITMQR